MRDRFDVVVVGAGQAGLAVGYELARAGRDFVLLDGASRVGAAWRSRWDSLRLFTPAAVDGLPGKAFPAGRNYRPTKDEMADFLEEYARTFDLPVRLASTVRRVFRDGDELVAETSGGRVAAPEIVIATGPYTVPRVPSFGRLLDPRVRQLHSIDYRNPGQLRDGGVLVAGAGNSGGEIAVDVAATHRTWLSGRDTGYVPFDVDASLYQLLGRLRTDRLPGRAIAGWLAGSGTPLVRIGAPDLAAAGIERVARVTGVTDGRPVLADGRVLEVGNVIWCTGFVTDLSWIELPAFGADGEPAHRRGAAGHVPGLFFAGMRFQSTLASGIIGGVGTDARIVVDAITGRARPHRPAAAGLAEIRHRSGRALSSDFR